MTKFRILIATGIYPPDIGGPATYSKLLVEELLKRDIGVDVLSFGEVRKLSKIIRHIVYIFKLLMRAGEADVIYAQDPVSVGFPSAIVAKILRKKFILKIVGDYAWEQFQRSVDSSQLSVASIEDFQNEKYNFITELRRKIERWTAKEADKIIVPSEYLKKIVMMWSAQGGLASGWDQKINIVYNSFDIPKSSGEIKKDLDGTILISAGRLVSWKGFDVLIEIMPEILKEISDAKLYIIGSGLEEEKLKSKIKNLNLEKHIFLVGQISREELFSYLRTGDVFVLNTDYEGFSHQILEAMAVGIPIITTNVGGNPEIITDRESGFLVEFNNKEQLKRSIIDLCGNKELKNKIISNAKETVEQFNKERMISETIKILSQ